MTRKATSGRETRFDDYIGIPIEKATKREIAEVADAEERNPTDMARMLLKEALTIRRARVPASAAD